jgi:hypothetical protein
MRHDKPQRAWRQSACVPWIVKLAFTDFHFSYIYTGFYRTTMRQSLSHSKGSSLSYKRAKMNHSTGIPPHEAKGHGRQSTKQPQSAPWFRVVVYGVKQSQWPLSRQEPTVPRASSLANDTSFKYDQRVFGSQE